MEIIESLSVGKHSPETSEDGIVITDDYVAVIDGSTSKTDRRILPDMTNGRLAMLTISEFIKEMDPDMDCPQFCQSITRHIRRKYHDYGVRKTTLIDHPDSRMTASAVIYNVKRTEIWMIGDCQCMVNGLLFTNEKPYEHKNAERRAQVIREALSKGATVEQLRHEDVGRQYILPLIHWSSTQQNIKFSVIDGFHIPMEHVRQLLVPLAMEIVLASDGYPKLFDTLAASEAYLQEVIAEDPLFIDRHPATKGVMAGNLSFDDRSYVRIKVR